MFQSAKAFSAAPRVPVIVQRQNNLSSKQPAWGNISFSFFLSKQEAVSQSHAGGFLEIEGWEDLCRGRQRVGLRSMLKSLLSLEFSCHVRCCMSLWPSGQIRKSATGPNHHLHHDMDFVEPEWRQAFNNVLMIFRQLEFCYWLFDYITFHLCRK